MSDETKQGALRNADGALSIKKVLGVIAGAAFIFGCGVFIFLAYKSGELAEALPVLDKLAIFSAALLGINLIPGAINKIADKAAEARSST